MRRLGLRERRARLGRRHLLASRAGAVVEAATALVGGSVHGFGFAAVLRDLFQVDMVKTLRQLNAIGYDEVELASFGQRTATEVRAALDKTHLSAPSAHVSLQALRENLSLVLGNAKILEVKYIVCPWIDEEFRNPAGYRQVAAMLNQAGNVARRAGHLIAYHNQDYEFAEVNGERG